MSSITFSGLRPHRSGFAPLILRLLEWLHQAVERRQLINELGNLTERDLRDIGVERHDIGARIDADMTAVSLRSLR